MFSSPSPGNVRALVVPVVFKDEATTYTTSNAAGKEALSAINTAFFGTSSDTKYWESLSTYYNKSSYGKLNITGTVTDFFYTASTLKTYEDQSDKAGNSASITTAILEDAYTNFFTGASPAYKVSDYDSNSDGTIDVIWLVYMHSYAETNNDYHSGLLWAYTYWDFNDYDALANYSWASYDFINEGTQTGFDAHTFIHETGHQMGLDDYYSYDDDTKTSIARAPLGGTDMMDYNIVDHCSFSKYCLGWVTPTVAVNDSSYTLKPFESSGDCLLLASNFNGTCFDEYYLLEYYTPTGLNQLDSQTTYTNNLEGLTDSGLRILHVDQRLGKIVEKKTAHSSSWVWDGNYYDIVDTTEASTYYYTPVNSNSKEYCYDISNYNCLVSLVQASGQTNLVSTDLNTSKKATNADLFDTSSYIFGQEIKPMSDEGWALPDKVTITSMDSTGITINLTSI
jgi:M6 family metalloprotease-like protein